jgi:hypothetical protein
MSNLDAPPIWHRFRETFLYALHPTPLVIALLIGALFAFLEPGFLLSLVLLFVGFRYAVEVFEQTAQGHLKPPGISSEVLIEDYGVTVKLFVLLFLIILLVGSIATSAGSLSAMFVWYFFLLALPASYMTLMLTGSLLQAINPLALLKMIAVMGWSYWLLYGLLFLLSTAWQNVATVVSGVSNGALYSLLFYVCFFYFNVIAFHMMGYMIYRRGDVFGTVRQADIVQASPFHLFDELTANGHHDAARAELKRLIAESPMDLGLYRRMHNVALVDQAIQDLEANAAKAIPMLIAHGRGGEAAEIYLDCARHDVVPKRMPAESVVALARQLRSMNRPKDAFKLLNGFHKRYPASELVFDAYFLAAQTLSEDLSRDDLSTQLLKYLAKHCANHSKIGEVHQYLQVIARLGTA